MFRFLLSVISCVAFLWTGGLVAFLHSMPEASRYPEAHTDAIVVLTGGDLRVAKGFKLWQTGKADWLFISGVDKSVSREALITQFAGKAAQDKATQEAAQIVLDYAASDTQSNAAQTAAFMTKHRLSSLRLVTANYHMPRALLECRLLLPETLIVADPVSPSAFRRDQWWRHETTRRLVLFEYHKYWLVRARAWVGIVP